MIKSDILKKIGKKIKKMDLNIHIPLCKFKLGCKKKGIQIEEDKDYLYIKDDEDLKQIADLSQNKQWMKKIARHRVKEDCEGCTYLDEEKHLGKSWCEKWDTDIWNVASVFPEDKHETNKACIPFRYFGYTPNMPSQENQIGQYSLEHYGMKNEKVIEEFVKSNCLEEVGKYYTKDKDTFIGEFNADNKFGIRYNPNINKIQLKIEASIGHIDKDYDPVYGSLKQMQNDWTSIWLEKKALNKKSEIETVLWAVKKGDEDWQEQIITTNESKIEEAKKWAEQNGFHKFRIQKLDLTEKPDFTKTINIDKKAYNPDINKPRQEREFDFYNKDDYKKKHNPQKTKQYDQGPTNVGDNKNYDPETYNSFGKSDRDVGNLI